MGEKMKSAYFRERARKGREHALTCSGPLADTFREVAQVWENLASRLEAEISRSDSDRDLENGPDLHAAAGVSCHGA